jgi:murein DD-endopeptidase MepM/ murein hydrolase activator NlpD
MNNLKKADSKFGIGGYAEHRTVYSRSGVFDADNPEGEPRRLHLGVDIWGVAGEPVYAPLGGMVHSFAFNDHYGDYGATIILLHQLDGFPFYTLYGHLALKDIEKLKEGQYIIRGQQMAHFGSPHENGHWPPHLHFQLILDLGVYWGDYPGVCRYSEKDFFLDNCPDPDLILQMNKLIS